METSTQRISRLMALTLKHPGHGDQSVHGNWAKGGSLASGPLRNAKSGFISERIQRQMVSMGGSVLGSTAGGAAGAALGSVISPIGGQIAGAFFGSYLGATAGRKLAMTVYAALPPNSKRRLAYSLAMGGLAGGLVAYKIYKQIKQYLPKPPIKSVFTGAKETNLSDGVIIDRLTEVLMEISRWTPEDLARYEALEKEADAKTKEFIEIHYTVKHPGHPDQSVHGGHKRGLLHGDKQKFMSHVESLPETHWNSIYKKAASLKEATEKQKGTYANMHLPFSDFKKLKTRQEKLDEFSFLSDGLGREDMEAVLGTSLKQVGITQKHPGHGDQKVHGRWAKGGSLSSGGLGRIAKGEAKPVSDGLKVGGPWPATKAHIRQTIAVIDSVHNDGNLPTIPINSSATMPEGVHGWFGWKTDGRADKIQINVFGDAPMMTSAHEIGHFLDHSGAGDQKGNFATTSKPAFKKAVAAMRNTPEMKKWARVAETGIINVDGRDIYIGQRAKDYANYLLDPREMFARSYAQYIAVKSNNRTMMHELRKQQSDPLTSQFSDASFKPIMRQMETAFKAEGWTVNK